jgi:23S rRNA (cytosine1962-C5)-methyltransferase
LDCFCNSGGFSLNAALTAKAVTSVDVSELALSNVKRNAELNGLTNITTVQADVFNFLREEKAKGAKYDLIVLDPPAFCKTANDVKDAYRGYKDINLTAMKLVKNGGFLATCSCSHYMTFPLFEKMLAESAKECGKRVCVLEMKTQAPDHPTLLNEEETQYLKFFVLQVL